MIFLWLIIFGYPFSATASTVVTSTVTSTIASTITSTTPSLDKEKCTQCHREQWNFSPFHNVKYIGCVSCHGGNISSIDKQQAHQGLEAYPGNMTSINKSCGQAQCHQSLVSNMQHSIMHTVSGMIEITRENFPYLNNKIPMETHQQQSILLEKRLSEQLSEQGADSYLRKLCVSCHLGTKRSKHEQTLNDRGGGCSACHLEKRYGYHPRLTLNIDDKRCFGCHSRSARISLNYRGYAEVEQIDPSRPDDFGYLADQRLIEKKQADIHLQAGLSCIDCHTVTEIMGDGKKVSRQAQQQDIQCIDCHVKKLNQKAITQLTAREAVYFLLYPPEILKNIKDKVFITQKKKTPLFHLSEKKGIRQMILKNTLEQKVIPIIADDVNHQRAGHERLSCDACHSSWAPQCYGCHINYDPKQSQFDHLEAKATPGRWIESRWEVRSELPALGVSADNKIKPFIPGMNFMLDHPQLENTITHLRYSMTSPHTTQAKARSCQSCHQNNAALGIIQKFSAHSKHKNWLLPIGWITENQSKPGKAIQKNARSFNQKEISRIRRVGYCLTCHQQDDIIFNNFSSPSKTCVNSTTPKVDIEK